jgi:hypothetical protein
MLEITPHSSPSVGHAVASPRTDLKAPSSRAAQQPAVDSLDLSTAALDYESQPQAAHETDAGLQGLRDRIAAGTYLTDDKVAYVVDRLYEELVSATRSAP